MWSWMIKLTNPLWKGGKGLDVLYWQAGERLYRFVRQGLIEPIDDVWVKEHWGDSFTQGVKLFSTFLITGDVETTVHELGKVRKRVF